jgi:hypothetical protein
MTRFTGGNHQKSLRPAVCLGFVYQQKPYNGIINVELCKKYRNIFG